MALTESSCCFAVQRYRRSATWLRPATGRGRGLGRCLLTLLACLATAEATRGEVPAWLREIARRPNFTKPEKGKVDDWVQQQVDTLTTSNNANAAALFRLDFEQFTKPQDSKSVSDVFRGLLAEKCSARFGAKLSKVDGDPALEMAIVLAELGTAKAVEGLVACLKHPNGGIRYWGAKGLRQNRRYWDKTPATARPAIEAINEAAASETNEIIVRHIQASFDYDPDTDRAPQALVAELIKVVNQTMPARIEAYRTGRIRLIAADREWPRILVGLWLSNHAPDAQKPVVLGHVGRLLVAATELYLDGERRYRGNDNKLPPLDPGAEIIQYRPKSAKGNFGTSGMPPPTTLTDVVAACEAALRSVTSGAMPKVHELLLVDRPQKLQESKIRLELLKWVGSNEVPGVLNESPLNVQVPPPFKIERANAPRPAQ